MFTPRLHRSRNTHDLDNVAALTRLAVTREALKYGKDVGLILDIDKVVLLLRNGKERPDTYLKVHEILLRTKVHIDYIVSSLQSSQKRPKPQRHVRFRLSQCPAGWQTQLAMIRSKRTNVLERIGRSYCALCLNIVYQSRLSEGYFAMIERFLVDAQSVLKELLEFLQ